MQNQTFEKVWVASLLELRWMAEGLNRLRPSRPTLSRPGTRSSSSSSTEKLSRSCTATSEQSVKSSINTNSTNKYLCSCAMVKLKWKPPGHSFNWLHWQRLPRGAWQQWVVAVTVKYRGFVLEGLIPRIISGKVQCAYIWEMDNCTSRHFVCISLDRSSPLKK